MRHTGQIIETTSFYLKPATHLAILYADRGELDRQPFSPPIDADTPGYFVSPIAAMWHLNLVHVIKSPNLID